MSILVGLTGGIATGKSTVSKYLAAKGIPIIDGDKAARYVVEVGMPGLQKLVKHFGTSILLPDGSLDRKKLGAIVFSDKEKQQLLNELLHPAIYQWMDEERERLEKEQVPLIVFDVPLLFETKVKRQYDHILVVAADEKIQLERLMRRNQLSEEEAKQRMDSQMPLAEKIRQADDVIDNSFDLETTYRQVDKWLEKVKKSQ